MKAVIIEDEPLAVERLEKMLKEVAVDIEIVARLSSVAASIEWLKKHSCDTLDQLERCLDPEHFFRINRKYLVHLKSIANMQLWSPRRIKLTLTPPADEAMDTLVSLERVGDFKRWMNR